MCCPVEWRATVNGDDSTRFVGTRLRASRKAAGLSQEELADRSGLSVRAVKNIEQGRTQRPYRVSLNRLADALGLGETARAESLAAVTRRVLATDPGMIVRQPPPRTRDFTGRAAELAGLDGLLDHVGFDQPGAAVITVIGGMAGAGKTALAVHWRTSPPGISATGSCTRICVASIPPARPQPRAGNPRAPGSP